MSKCFFRRLTRCDVRSNEHVSLSWWMSKVKTTSIYTFDKMIEVSSIFPFRLRRDSIWASWLQVNLGSLGLKSFCLESMRYPESGVRTNYGAIPYLYQLTLPYYKDIAIGLGSSFSFLKFEVFIRFLFHVFHYY